MADYGANSNKLRPKYAPPLSHVPSVQGVLECVKAYSDALHKMCGTNNEIFCRRALDAAMKLLTLLERSQYGALYGLEVITTNQKRKPQRCRTYGPTVGQETINPVPERRLELDEATQVSGTDNHILRIEEVRCTSGRQAGPCKYMKNAALIPQFSQHTVMRGWNKKRRMPITKY